MHASLAVADAKSFDNGAKSPTCHRSTQHVKPRKPRSLSRELGRGLDTSDPQLTSDSCRPGSETRPLGRRRLVCQIKQSS
jgi:hypothetical protein